METIKKRCPKGTRKNKVTNECDKLQDERRRCPKGSRKNKQTNDCDILERQLFVPVEEITPIEIIPIEENIPIENT